MLLVFIPVELLQASFRAKHNLINSEGFHRMSHVKDRLVTFIREFIKSPTRMMTVSKTRRKLLSKITSVLALLMFRFLMRRKEPNASSRCLENVDVIVTVHNALHYLQKTIHSIESSELGSQEARSVCASIYLVDSRSNAETARYLSRKARERHPFIEYIIINRHSTSYTSAANAGISAGKARFVALLNSDIVLPYFWISRMVRVLHFGPSVGVVGPLSNSACYQSIPVVSPREWAQNSLPHGLTVQSVNGFLQRRRVSAHPYVPLLNGFLLVFKRKVVETIGYLDEIAYPEGYGEENDFCLRARKAGFSLQVVCDVFVYHSKSSSFGSDRRRTLIAAASSAYSPILKNYIRLAHQELLHDSFFEELRNQSKLFYDYRQDTDANGAKLVKY
jgi:GT2 family glycosyltransferase